MQFFSDTWYFICIKAKYMFSSMFCYFLPIIPMPSSNYLRVSSICDFPLGHKAMFHKYTSKRVKLHTQKIQPTR